MAFGDHPVIAVIPARLASTRFPGKVLASETGKPLIQHVYEAASGAATPDQVIIATESDEVVQAVRGFGAEAILTRDDHPNGASRIAETCDIIDAPDDAIILNVQGDEPEMDAGAIDAAVEAMANSEAPMATIASPFGPDEQPADPNLVKVVLNVRGEAIYFSRALIPHDRDGQGIVAPLKHVGLYAYRRPFLQTYVELAPTPLEQSEMLEQLRVIENGYSIAVAVRPCASKGIDTPEQYAAFVARWRKANA